MSADRETNHGMTSHDMTNTDIALLLADAADEVEIGIAPYQAVMRGGRRRRARRWAVTAATALVLAGATGGLAVAGLQGRDGRPTPPAATQSPTEEQRDLYTAQRTTLATGVDHGKEWAVVIDVWPAPRDEAEAAGQWAAMGHYSYGERPADTKQSSDLVGKSSFFVWRNVGDHEQSVTMLGTFAEGDTLSDKDIEHASLPLDPNVVAPHRLVIGQVATSAQRVSCTWADGTATEVRRVPKGYDINTDEQVIRPADGSPTNWFVCLAPEGTEYKSAEVTK
ncbi:hypothetical protein [Streptomyces sp. HD]|uniref:hypothetical protein n=1 Tax=Streptomyces sp. HD TaxID=3020892 RepID=UPI00232F2B05|nr:hypothetical protein [Streptomyces sp. HD]MDC0768281.1 hypothetical protein [Streptomyces sp. HD]